MPLEPSVGNTTWELLGMALARHVAASLRDMGGWTVKQAYDAQAAAGLAELPPAAPTEQGTRALQWSIEEVDVAHWWVKLHQEVSGVGPTVISG